MIHQGTWPAFADILFGQGSFCQSLSASSKMRSSTFLSLAAAVSAALACDSCYGPSNAVIHERNVRRMQPEASGATNGPKAPLEWGQINFLHTVSGT
jgi:hypothetical protein